MAKEIKLIWENLNKAAFFICLVFSVLLITASFIVPPLGTLHPSVLTAVGELFGFSSLSVVLAAIDKGHKVTVSHGNTNLSVNKDETVSQ